jgi:two-component system, chemotaxis family, protein-glutamate methylesterase/glutaminase
MSVTRRSIFALGASAGGLEALRAIVERLPARFAGSLFVVQHMARNTPSQLPDILGRASVLPVLLASEGQPIEAGAIYVARPDHHLVLERGRLRLAQSPSQHRHRPAIDVTFRSAAVAYGSSVVGVVLSGMLDDGCAGLASIKECGGIAVVQDPADARFPNMPQSALDAVSIDHCLPAHEIASLLARLASETAEMGPRPSDALEVEVFADRGGDPPRHWGRPSQFACPECHGVLWEGEQQGLKHYRCRIGHAYSSQTLASILDEGTENALWAAVRSLEERASLARRMAEQWREREEFARELQDKAQRSEEHAARIRAMLLSSFQTK